MNDVNAHTEGFSDGVNGRCTASGCVGPQRSPTLHIYDPPWDALGYNASVARAVAAVYAEVMVAPVDTRFSYVGASTAIFNELPRLFPAAPAASADLFLLPLHPWALCFANDVVVGQRHKDRHGIHQKLHWDRAQPPAVERQMDAGAAAPLPVGDGVPAAGRALRRALDRAGAAGARQPKPGPTELTILSHVSHASCCARYQYPGTPHSSWPRPASTIATTPSAHVSKYENASVKTPQK